MLLRLGSAHKKPSLQVRTEETTRHSHSLLLATLCTTLQVKCTGARLTLTEKKVREDM